MYVTNILNEHSKTSIKLRYDHTKNVKWKPVWSGILNIITVSGWHSERALIKMSETKDESDQISAKISHYLQVTTDDNINVWNYWSDLELGYAHEFLKNIELQKYKLRSLPGLPLYG